MWILVRLRHEDCDTIGGQLQIMIASQFWVGVDTQNDGLHTVIHGGKSVSMNEKRLGWGAGQVVFPIHAL